VKLTVQEVRSQKLFGDACVAKLNHSPPLISAGQFLAHINTMLKSAQDVEAPPDASPSGELMMHLKRFCTSFTLAETREELFTDKPFIEEGIVYFQSSAFNKYLWSQHFLALKGQALWAVLRDNGVAHKQLRIGTKVLQVWYCKAFVDEPDEPIPPRTVPQTGEM